MEREKGVAVNAVAVVPALGEAEEMLAVANFSMFQEQLLPFFQISSRNP